MKGRIVTSDKGTMFLQVDGASYSLQSIKDMLKDGTLWERNYELANLLQAAAIKMERNQMDVSSEDMDEFDPDGKWDEDGMD